MKALCWIVRIHSETEPTAVLKRTSTWNCSFFQYLLDCFSMKKKRPLKIRFQHWCSWFLLFETVCHSVCLETNSPSESVHLWSQIVRLSVHLWVGLWQFFCPYLPDSNRLRARTQVLSGLLLYLRCRVQQCIYYWPKFKQEGEHKKRFNSLEKSRWWKPSTVIVAIGCDWFQLSAVSRTFQSPLVTAVTVVPL